MKRILFVCLGNICRSPLAEAIFNHKIKELGLDHQFESDSCGTSNYHIGDQPDRRTIQNATKNGVAIQHAARQLTENDLEVFDLVIAMDKSNYQHVHLLSNASRYAHKIKLMREFDTAGSGDVPDPYYGGEKEFQHVFEILDRSLEQLIQRGLR
jgi:protein-tyrosine phosphatase